MDDYVILQDGESIDSDKEPSTDIVGQATIPTVSIPDFSDPGVTQTIPSQSTPEITDYSDLTYTVRVPGYIRERVTDFSPEKLAEYESDGWTAVAIYSDGTEEEVLWSEVVEPIAEEIEIDIAGIAEAYNQHFWTDTNGAHVTDSEQDIWIAEYNKQNHGTLETPTVAIPWHNLLMNSLGILLRNGLKNLASFSKAGVAFFDGTGNESTNVTAAYGGQTAQIGKITEKHVMINANGLTAYNGDGTIAPITGVFDGANISNSTIDNSKIIDGTITNAKISDGTITNAKISNGTIDNSKIANGTITGSKIASSTITGSNIVDNSITGGKIQGSTLTNIPYAEIDQLKTRNITAAAIEASTGYIAALTAGSLTAAQLLADTGYIDDLTAGNLTAQDILADHATVGSLDTNYAQINMANVNNAWIQNGTVKDGAITNAMINSVSANKLTAGTIDASNITVTNLNASNITTGTINGQRIGTGSLSLDKLAEDVYTESEVNTIVSGLNARIDAQIETWTVDAIPTLNNTPASSWTTNTLKTEHVGDICYVVNANSQADGYTYRFTYDVSTQVYSWILIKDNQVTAALQRLLDAEGDIDSLETFQSETSTWISQTDTELSTIRSNYTSLTSQVANKVETSTFNTLSSTVDTNSATITSMSTVLTNNGLTSSTNISNTVNTVSQTASGNSSKLSQLTTTLGTNADGTTKTGDIVHRTSDIEQDLDGFKTTVSNTYATNTRVSQAESSITQNANNIALKVSQDGVISAINQSSESITINANKVNIEGAAIFTSGRLSQSSLNNAYDAKGAVDAANAQEQLIYKSAASGTTSMTAPSGWITDITGSQDTWTIKRPQYSQDYPVLFIATQRKTVGDTITCTTPLKDDTTTIIDGGNIITGSVSIGAFTSATQGTITDAAKTATNYIYADSTGIRIADANPSTATTYQHQTATSTEFVVNGSVRASYGTEVKLGGTSSNYVGISTDKFKFIGGKRRLLEIYKEYPEELIEDSNGVITAVAQKPSSGQSTSWILDCIPCGGVDNVSVISPSSDHYQIDAENEQIIFDSDVYNVSYSYSINDTLNHYKTHFVLYDGISAAKSHSMVHIQPESTRIGYESGTHVLINDSGLSITGEDGNEAAIFGTNVKQIFHRQHEWHAVSPSTYLHIPVELYGSKIRFILYKEQALVSQSDIIVGEEAIASEYESFESGAYENDSGTLTSINPNWVGYYREDIPEIYVNLGSTPWYDGYRYVELEYYYYSDPKQVIALGPQSYDYTIGNRIGLIGTSLRSVSDNSLAIGQWNDPSNSDVFTIGNGTDAENRSNALAVKSDGSVNIGPQALDGTGSGVTIHSSNASSTSETPSTNNYGNLISCYDKANIIRTYVRHVSRTDGYQGIQLETKRIISGSNIYNTLNLFINASGTRKVEVNDADVWQQAIGALGVENGTDNYPRIVVHSGRTNRQWVGTPSSGLLPYTKDSTNGSSSVGTSSWPFANVYAKNFAGGNWNGNTVAVNKGGTGLTASPSLQVNLASTAAANVLQASPRPGVTGTLAIGNGGTGHTGTAGDTISLASGALAYDSGQAPRCYRWGKVVTLWGAAKPKSQVAANGTFTIGTVPEGFRPPATFTTLIQGSGHAIGMIQITSAGVVTVSRYQDGGSYIAIGTSNWINLYCTYVIA